MNLGSTWNFSTGCSKWKDIEISSTKYITCTIEGNDKWKIILSNLVEIWTEILTWDVALTRCQKLNPFLDTDSFDVRQIITDILNDVPKHAIDKSVSRIKLRTIVEGGSFIFTLDLTKGNPQQFFKEITKPLCHSLMEIQHRYTILLDLVKRKDEEITEYKSGGAELIRKNIETEKFHDNLFKTKSLTCNVTNCINAFQTITDLCSDINLLKDSIKKDPDELSCTSSAESEVRVKDEVEISETISDDGTSKEIPVDSLIPKTEIIDTTNSNIVVEQQIDGKTSDDNRKAKVERKTTLHLQNSCDPKETNSNVTIASNLMKKPMKRPRKTVNINDFIS